MGYYVHVKFHIYRPYCYFVVWGTVMTSGRVLALIYCLTWGRGFCGITFDFIRQAYAAR